MISITSFTSIAPMVWLGTVVVTNLLSTSGITGPS